MENKKVIWFDIDNCLYGRSSRISEMMQEKISLYFLHIGVRIIYYKYIEI